MADLPHSARESDPTLRTRLRLDGVPPDMADELELHLKEAIHLGRPELLTGYLRWRWAHDIERGELAATLIDRFSQARDGCLARWPQAETIWPEEPSSELLESEARISLLDDSDDGRLATAFLTQLLAADRRPATRLILDQVDSGLSIERLYLNVFQPVLIEIGRLWQINSLDVGQEHFCTAVIQAIMAQLYPHIGSRNPVKKRMVVTTASGELHEIGIRMVADIFELNGWDTYFMSCDCPSAAVIASLSRQRPDVLAVGVTTLRHVEEVRRLITEVRSTPDVRDTIVLTGGYIFNRLPTLWQELGADGCAHDAVSAVTVANQLTETPS